MRNSQLFFVSKIDQNLEYDDSKRKRRFRRNQTTYNTHRRNDQRKNPDTITNFNQTKCFDSTNNVARASQNTKDSSSESEHNSDENVESRLAYLMEEMKKLQSKVKKKSKTKETKNKSDSEESNNDNISSSNVFDPNQKWGKPAPRKKLERWSPKKKKKYNSEDESYEETKNKKSKVLIKQKVVHDSSSDSSTTISESNFVIVNTNKNKNAKKKPTVRKMRPIKNCNKKQNQSKTTNTSTPDNQSKISILSTPEKIEVSNEGKNFMLPTS